MTTTLSSSSRRYRPMGHAPSTGRLPPPMPSALSKIALATRQNQIMALQALQATATASTSSSSSSSSSPGSPPPSSFGSASFAPKRGRKFQACRAPSSASAGKEYCVSASTAALGQSPNPKTVSLISTTTPHWAPEGSYPLIDPSSGRRSEIYSLTNDRYPGAPGTALAKAREAQQKANQAAKRKAVKKLASKAELEHLGVKDLSKKRKSSSPYATIGEGNVASTSAAAADKSTALSRDSSTTSRSRAAAANASAKANGNTEAGIASSSRSRRPASRSNSPVPITSAQTSARRGGTRGASSAPTADEESTGKSSARSPSRGNSPPEGNLKGPLSNLASTAPFQSSPLAAGSVTLEPSIDVEMAEQDKKLANPKVIISSDESPSAGRGSSLKRKASTLSQEIGADKPAEENVTLTLVEEQEADADSSKKAKIEATTTEATRETSPSSVSSSRRTSPRIKTRGLAAAADSSKAAFDKFTTDAETSNATKSRLSALSLEHANADGSIRTSRNRRGAKSDVDVEEVRDEDLGRPGNKAA